MLMIVGLVLFITVGLVLYLSKSTVKKTAKETIKKSQEAAIETQPIKEYVDKCLGKLTKDALILLGKQGGYLYKSQGGPIVDYQETDIGKYFLKYDNLYASYNIMPPKFSVATYYSEPPDYPWVTFPYNSVQSSLLEQIKNGKSLMFIGAHPDDELLIGTLLTRACSDYGNQCTLVSITPGD